MASMEVYFQGPCSFKGDSIVRVEVHLPGQIFAATVNKSLPPSEKQRLELYLNGAPTSIKLTPKQSHLSLSVYGEADLLTQSCFEGALNLRKGSSCDLLIKSSGCRIDLSCENRVSAPPAQPKAASSLVKLGEKPYRGSTPLQSAQPKAASSLAKPHSALRQATPKAEDNPNGAGYGRVYLPPGVRLDVPPGVMLLRLRRAETSIGRFPLNLPDSTVRGEEAARAAHIIPPPSDASVRLMRQEQYRRGDMPWHVEHYNFF